MSLVSASLLGSWDDGEAVEADYRIVDLPTPTKSLRAGTTQELRETTATPDEVSLTDCLEKHLESYPGDVLVDFTGVAASDRADGWIGQRSDTGEPVISEDSFDFGLLSALRADRDAYTDLELIELAEPALQSAPETMLDTAAPDTLPTLWEGDAFDFAELAGQWA